MYYKNVKLTPLTLWQCKRVFKANMDGVSVGDIILIILIDIPENSRLFLNISSINISMTNNNFFDPI